MRYFAPFLTVVVCALALAADPVKPELVEEADLLRVQLAQARVDLAQRTLNDAKRVADEVNTAVQTKYKLGPEDAVDPQTRVIRRASKKTTK